MRLRNREGVPVDPVPFLVVALLAATVLLSFGPLYLQEFGLTLEVAVVISAVLSIAAAVLSYHRFVWNANPLTREEVPAATRYLNLLYAIAFFVLLLLALLALLEVT